MNKNAFSDYNQQMRDLWSEVHHNGKWPDGIPHLWPMQYPSLTQKPLLFIGFNPSLSSYKHATLKLSDFGDLGEPKRIGDVIDRETTMLGLNGKEKMSKYFLPLGKVAGDDQWLHIDLFAVRHTNQQKLRKGLEIQLDPNLELSDFGDRQMIECVKLADAINPDVVVVVNALASYILLARLENSLCWCQKIGTYVRNKQPWFFSGMLSGQRALDTHSRERLKWHVQRCRNCN